MAKNDTKERSLAWLLWLLVDLFFLRKNGGAQVRRLTHDEETAVGNTGGRASQKGCGEFVVEKDPHKKWQEL